jgi:hypothetical protein
MEAVGDYAALGEREGAAIILGTANVASRSPRPRLPGIASDDGSLRIEACGQMGRPE